MKTMQNFKIGEPIFLNFKTGWNIEITHPDHTGFFAIISGNTKEECIKNAKLMVHSFEMLEALKEISMRIENLQVPTDFKIKIKSLLKEIES